MIFVTVGSQLPFDRLIKSMDAWVEQHPSEECIAQIGNATFVPTHMQSVHGLSSGAFRQNFDAARIVVSHAGVGNILMAMELRKPIIIMPRRAELGEHRNDHQMAMTQKLKERLGICVALDEAELFAALSGEKGVIAPPASSPYASEDLLRTVRQFILLA